jgi:hypothetical protein
MAVRGSFSRRNGTRLSRHVSYANVMATVAVFIALGGTGYAMSQISGSQIKNRSIAHQKLNLHTLTASEIKSRSILGQDLALHTVTADELRDLVVSAKGRSAKGRSAQARAAQGSTAPPTIITLSVGQSATILQSGPFTYTATCTADSNGKPLVGIQAESSEAGSLIDIAFDSSGHLLSSPYQLTPGQPAYASAPSSTPFFHLINANYMIAPSGAQLIANISFGTGQFGGACWAGGFGVA